MKRIGTLKPGVEVLRLHGSPNGVEKGFMYRGDEFVLDDIPARKNSGGNLWWVRGAVARNEGMTQFTCVWVAQSKLDIVELVDPPDFPPPAAPLPAPELSPSFPWRIAVAVAIGIALLVAAAFAL